MQDPRRVPTLSVVIPAYNSSETIERAIRSALASCADEVIVVDDGSTDSTADIAALLGCTVVRQENLGAATARRTGLGRVHSALLSFLDADDELEPLGIRNAVELLAAETNLAGVVGRTRIRQESGVDGYIELWPEGVSVDSLLERGQAPGPPSSFVWRRRLVEEALSPVPSGVWPLYAEDYELIIRMSMQGRILGTQEVMSLYSPEGGKSARAPLRSLTASEDIRRHYAQQQNIDIRIRTSADLRAMASLRNAFAHSGPEQRIQRTLLILKATLTSPRLFAYLALRRVQRLRGRRRR